jgi:hypothetical protein
MISKLKVHTKSTYRFESCPDYKLKTKVMEQKKLVKQLIKASNKISKNRKPSANYIHLSEEYIQEQANERKISFDNMVEIIKKELTPKTNP